MRRGVVAGVCLVYALALGVSAATTAAATPPANDDFAAAEAIEPREIAYSAITVGATREPGEPDHRGEAGGASVWFEWTAPRTGGVLFQACNPVGKEAVAAVYTGTSVDALTPVPEIEELASCDYFFSATAGTTYRLAVDGRYNAALGAVETFKTQVSIGYAPQNDDFEDALLLADPFSGPYKSAVIAGFRNAGATKQPGEPDHAGNPGGASVWATWTAPLTGSVHLRLCQTDFAALLAVYTGSSVGALTPVASGPGTLSPGCPTNRDAAGGVSFDIVAGTTYDIAIDGVDGATGYTNLELWTSDEPVQAPAAPSPAEPPTTKIAGRKLDGAKRTATFSLRSDVAGSTFRCKLDRGAFRRCAKRMVFRHLSPGRHTFRAEAISPSGLLDKTPAKSRFRFARRIARG